MAIRRRSLQQCTDGPIRFPSRKGFKCISERGALHLQRHGASRTRHASELLQDGYPGASVHRPANRRLQRGELVGRQLLFAAIALLLVLVMQVSMGLAVPW